MLFRLIALVILIPCLGTAQDKGAIQLLHVRDSISFRGMSVPSGDVVWVSGSRGTVGRSTDGGRTWQWQRVPGFEQRDFRDIEAFDRNTALVMAIAEPAQILRTVDGGKTWKVVFADSTQGMFLDAMHFRDHQYGIVVGDPVNGKFFLKGTRDGGKTWNVDYPVPAALEGEACFAASGTNVITWPHPEFTLVTGGKVSRMLTGSRRQVLPLIQGKKSTGANAVAQWAKNLVVVGGDFADDTNTRQNCIISKDGGQTWTHPTQPPKGYRSCVTFLNQNTLIACGTSGVDVSRDGGKTWQSLSPESYHVCQPDQRGKIVFLAGAQGKIARLVIEK